jgi:hypothetical protein
LDTRYIASIRGYESIRANNFEFYASILPFFTVIFTDIPHLEEKARFCKLAVQFSHPRSTVASRDCITFQLTGILLYTGITFKVPEHQSYIYIILLYIGASVQDRSLRHSTAYFPVNRHFAVYRIHFRFARTSVLYIFLYMSVRLYSFSKIDTVLSYITACVIPATTILFYKYTLFLNRSARKRIYACRWTYLVYQL